MVVPIDLAPPSLVQAIDIATGNFDRSTGTTAKLAADPQWDLKFQRQISVLCRMRAILPVLWRPPARCEFRSIVITDSV